MRTRADVALRSLFLGMCGYSASLSWKHELYLIAAVVAVIGIAAIVLTTYQTFKMKKERRK